ncbi:ArsR/SmtB family transcription factor [Halobaculum sp. D14]|uniref:ArsR/SmtB family transcription factor n=1 Tax=Halobaculum sp. D14 TaxID=3421642 RepID=UPI003EBAC8F5
MSEPIVDATDPDEAFAALADETRLAILRALADADGDEATFSALRDAVGMRDSGQFNYHLQKLTGTFVAKTDDSYRLTVAGRQIRGALLAGRYTKTGSVDPVPLDDPCPACGGDRTFHYDDQQVEITCDDCDLGSFFGIPPGVFAGYDADEWPAVANRYLRTVVQQAASGFCPFCDGRMRSRLADQLATTDDDASPPEEYRDVPTFRFTCDRCGETLAGDLGVALLDVPAVVAFYHDHGVDVRDEPLSAFRTISTDRARIVDRDPLRAAVTFTADDESLTVELDESLAVVEAERTD